MQKILVTGAAGFIGHYLAKTLADRGGVELILADNFIRGENDDLYRKLCQRPNVKAFHLDLANPQQIAQLPDEVDVIYHLAALNGTQNFYERPYEVMRCSTLPTFYLIEKYGRTQSLKKFLYAGTSEAYASTVTRFGWEIPTAEDVPLCIDDVFNPRWSYAASKMHGEVLTASALKSYNKPFSIIRYHNAYGPRMGDKHVVPDFIERMKKGIFELYGYEDTRTFMYIQDSVDATIKIGEMDATNNQVINVGGRREITILELAKIIMEISGKKGEIQLHPSPKGSVKRRVPSIKKLENLTSFKENWSLERGLKETIAYYLSR